MTMTLVGAGPTWTPRRRIRKDGKPYRRNIWHETLMQTYSDAVWDWEQRRDQAALGYATEEADFARQHPRPRLKDFMIRLSRDWRLAAAA
jgi:hypothetical protein